MGMKGNSGHFKNTNGYVEYHFRRYILDIKNKDFKKEVAIKKMQKLEKIFEHPTDEKMLKMNKEKQLRHIGKSSEHNDKSKMSLSIEETEQLILEFSGKGHMINENQEIVDCKKIIGYVETNGRLEPTTYIKIHYSKTGSHAVPYRKGTKNDK